MFRRLMLSGCTVLAMASAAIAQSQDVVRSVEELHLVAYPERLTMVKDLAGAGLFSNLSLEEPALIYAELGIWAGIYIQTLWQLDSARDQNPIWNQVNAFLTVAPYLIAKEMQCTENCKAILIDPGADKKTTAELEVVRSAWQKYFFRAANRKSSTRSLQRALWKAHADTIHYVKKRFKTELCQERSQALEWDFWQGWVSLVDVLAGVAFPTKEGWIQPISSRSFPTCSPLGQGDCVLKKMNRSQRNFVQNTAAIGRAWPGLRCGR